MLIFLNLHCFEALPPAWILESYNDIMHLRDLDAPVRIPWQDITAQPVGVDRSQASTEAG